MTAIQYIAVDRGELASGHSALTEYSFDISIQPLSISRRRIEDTTASLSGKRFTVLHSIERSYPINTREYKESNPIVEQMREFISSVSAGEVFSIDVGGSVLTPVSPKNVVLSGNPTERIGQGLLVSFSFLVVEV